MTSLRAKAGPARAVGTGTASSPVEIRDTGSTKIHHPANRWINCIVGHRDGSGSQSSSPAPPGPRTLKDICSPEPEVPPIWGHHQDQECEPYSILRPSAHSLFFFHRGQKCHLSPWLGPGQPHGVNMLLCVAGEEERKET